MTRQPYADTQVPVERSKEGIRQLLRKHGGIGSVHFAEEWTTLSVGIAFVMLKKLPQGGELPLMVKKTIPLFLKGKPWWAQETEPRYRKAVEQRERQVWRALFHHLKAQLEAVAFGLTSFEDVFLADIIAKDGRALGDHIKEAILGGHLALPARALQEKP